MGRIYNIDVLVSHALATQSKRNKQRVAMDAGNMRKKDRNNRGAKSTLDVGRSDVNFVEFPCDHRRKAAHGADSR